MLNPVKNAVAERDHESPTNDTTKNNIFVVGLEDFNRRMLEKVRHAERYAFHPLLDYESVAEEKDCRVEELIQRSCDTLDRFSGSIDAIVGYWDFPTNLMMPILRRRYGLPGPSLESVLRCEHKYWARRIQKETLPDVVPEFTAVDPFAEGAAENPPLPFPFWIKPVKAHSSKLGFRVGNRQDYREAIEATRQRIEHFAVNLNEIMSRAELPEEIAQVDGWKCIAEAIISVGRQCTLEGYVFEGEPEVYGVVDSIRGSNRSSFERYQYPSTLPETVQQRMIDAAKQLIAATGLDDSPFNIEFFWHRNSDEVWLLEINARISKSHSPLFEKVQGVPHNEVMIDVALGRRPEYPLDEGRFRHAAKFMLRRYDVGGRQPVTEAPNEDRIRQIEQEFPGCDINLHVHEGMRLEDLRYQDSYSFELAEIFVGANSQKELMKTYRAIVDRLGIEIGAAS